MLGWLSISFPLPLRAERAKRSHPSLLFHQHPIPFLWVIPLKTLVTLAFLSSPSENQIISH